MNKNLLTIFVAPLMVSSCATIKNYVPPKSSTSSEITVSREIKGPLLGTSTYIFTLAGPRECHGGLNVKEDMRLMTLDTTNPLIKQLNENGVSVISGIPLSLRIQSIAGSLDMCTIQADFTPEANRDYKIALSGRISSYPHGCVAELWSKRRGEVEYEKDSFKNYDDCKPK